ncbi:MAG: putative quinol monooxygenase [Gammaproteobacteria bacterium]
MSVTVTLAVTAKPECRDDLIAMFTENFKQTRGYDGCIEVYMTRSHDDPNELLLVQQWETRPHYEHYLAWRAETGAVDQLAAMADGDASIRFFDRLDA